LDRTQNFLTFISFQFSTSGKEFLALQSLNLVVFWDVHSNSFFYLKHQIPFLSSIWLNLKVFPVLLDHFNLLKQKQLTDNLYYMCSDCLSHL
jgi:hypothetical protein